MTQVNTIIDEGVLGARSALSDRATLRVGIIGCGEIARSSHIPAYIKCGSQVELVAVADVVKERAEACAREFSIPRVFSDTVEMIEQANLDAVSVCVPNKYHAPVTLAALQAGCHVLCEKPPAITAEEAERMADTARKTGKLLSYGFQYRYATEVRTLKRFVEEGELGEIYVARAQALRRRGIPGWGMFTDREIQGGGPLGSVGAFSFQSSKTLTSGEGGFVTTNDKALYERLYSLRNCGRRRKGANDEHWRAIQSGNYRMTEWQAAILCAQLECFEEQVKKREENAEMLDSLLGEIPGILPMNRQPQVTRRNPYAYVFRYDAKEFEGLSIRGFRKALSEETGIALRAPYRPLNSSSLYRPQTKRRHHLNDKYWENLNPKQFRLPVAERAYESEAVVFSHEVLLTDTSNLSAMPQAIRKLQKHASELVRWERTLSQQDMSTVGE